MWVGRCCSEQMRALARAARPRRRPAAARARQLIGRLRHRWRWEGWGREGRRWAEEGVRHPARSCGGPRPPPRRSSRRPVGWMCSGGRRGGGVRRAPPQAHSAPPQPEASFATCRGVARGAPIVMTTSPRRTDHMQSCLRLADGRAEERRSGRPPGRPPGALAWAAVIDRGGDGDGWRIGRKARGRLASHLVSNLASPGGGDKGGRASTRRRRGGRSRSWSRIAAIDQRAPRASRPPRPPSCVRSPGGLLVRANARGGMGVHGRNAQWNVGGRTRRGAWPPG